MGFGVYSTGFMMSWFQGDLSSHLVDCKLMEEKERSLLVVFSRREVIKLILFVAMEENKNSNPGGKLRICLTEPGLCFSRCARMPKNPYLRQAGDSAIFVRR